MKPAELLLFYIGTDTLDAAYEGQRLQVVFTVLPEAALGPRARLSNAFRS